MKIRQGFVSNSSSASFVVTVYNTNWEQFLEYLNSNFGFSIFDKRRFKEEVNQKIEQYKNFLKQQREEKKDILWKSDTNFYKVQIEQLEKIAKNIDNLSFAELVDQVFSFNKISTTRTEGTNVVELSSWTIMYNNAEDMEPLMKNLIANMLLDNRKIKVEVISD
jgi:hypothetical protein